VDLDTAREMIREVAAFRVLEGYRGRPAGDAGALAAALVALSQLANEPSVMEAEVNPMAILEEGRGVVAVDALVRVAS
jgi:succinyl-CoA synthetase beta subunit